jgi:hypothetical protein
MMVLSLVAIDPQCVPIKRAANSQEHRQMRIELHLATIAENNSAMP